ncbi:MAG: hypothetical protein AAB295_07170 [Chloroflexota bacterium]
MFPLRHRDLVYLPFVVFFLGTVVSGQFNAVDARGVVVDASTGEPVKDVPIVFGKRQTISDDQGRYELRGLPRGSKITARPKFSYGQTSVLAEATRIELPPITLNLQVNQKGTDPAKGADKPQVRQGEKVLGTGTETGSVVVVPYPEVGAKLLVCAAGYHSLDIEARGTVRTIELEFGGTGCPPLPSPSPIPGASPSGSPSPSPSPSPTATP